MKVTTFNIEWMNDFFYPDEPRFKASHRKKQYTGPSINDIPVLCSRIRNTIRQINPDILGIVEGPRLQSQMEEFVHNYLSDETESPVYSVVASPSERAQRTYLLVRRNAGMSVRTLQNEPRYEKMIRRWQFYPWGAYLPEETVQHGFYRRPLVAEIQSGERKFTIILLHIKSKHIGLRPTDEKTYVQKAILARQKITSEIKKVREYLDDTLMEEITRSIVVMGDLNDGPGRDRFEEEFMLQNLVDVIQGTLLSPELNIYHVLETLQTGAFTIEFEEEGIKRRELIDHILLSPQMFTGSADFAYSKGSGTVEHEAWESNLGSDPEGLRDDRPSDHRPVSCEIT